MKRILTYNLLNSAEKHPERLAFKQMNNTITYSELVSKSYQVARVLKNNGIKKGDRVGIFMNRSIESAYAVYGTLFAGAVFVPIDSALPGHGIASIVNDCGISTIITKDTFNKNLKKIQSEKTSLRHIIGSNLTSSAVTSTSWEQVFTMDNTSIGTTIKEEDNAYIIYTSGTTGNPKGIVHTHYSGASYAKLSADLYDLSHTDILGNHSHLHYDISTMGYLTMPYVGGCTIIVPEAHTKFPTSLAKLIEEEKMTIWYSVPLALIQLLEDDRLKDKDYSALRWILFGGESFRVEHITNLIRCLPHVQYSNVYGPAEVNQCTYYNFDNETQITEPIPLGNIWPETDVKILKTNSDDNSGELIVASSTQMHGYWNRPDLTNENFINLEDRRYYKTGDKGSKNEKGELMFEGRGDRQIKVRGHRVELNAIEAILMTHNSIENAAVYSIDSGDAKSIHARVTSESQAIDEKEIRQFLSSFLPQFSIPESIKSISNIPRTQAGKVDYKALQQ